MKEKILNFGFLLMMIVALAVMNFRSELRCNFLNKDCKSVEIVDKKDLKKILNAIKKDADVAALEIIIE
jgi:hypothetical protein